MPGIHAELDGIDIQTVEARQIVAARCCQHGDLHCANIVFDQRGGAMLIDFGDAGLSFASVDPVTLELSTIFHLQAARLPQGWPSEALLGQWGTLDAYIAGCAFPAFIQACREWALAVAGSPQEVWAVAYAYALRQLKYGDTNKVFARALIRPYYLTPDGKVGHDAFAVIRETIREMNKVAIGRVVLTNREHIIALEPLDKGLMGTLLHYPYEVRSADEYFDDIQDVKVTKDMLDLAKHIVNQKAGHFEPDKFEDQYETALIDLINQKRAGKSIAAKARPRGENVVDLMDALRKSIGGGAATATESKKSAKKPRKAAAGQKEMLMPIAGKKPKDAAAKKSTAKQQRKSA
ncbi:Ku protein [Bradyrhizobium sp. Leo170]|uniref:Ku protein n=1 Tax=Bradyrhizobium sp. Leo170 TaxID=1571199 RepID=UPI0013EE65FF|nr:Ku protein [Bradyrhizobium sp. Leo170]